MIENKEATITTKDVTISFDGVTQHSDELFRLAEVYAVGHGGDLLSMAFAEVLFFICNDSYVPDRIKLGLFVDLNKCIDLITGEAIRDLAVRAEVLKRQIAGDKNRRAKLSGYLSKVLLNTESSWRSRVGKENWMLALELESMQRRKFMDALNSLFQDWIEKDRIEGIPSDDITWHMAAFSSDED